MIALLRKATALNASDRELLRAAFAALMHARIAAWILPWRRFASPAKTPAKPRHVPQSPSRIEWAVRVASRAVPGTTCLTQSLALHRLLLDYRHSSIVQVGVGNTHGRFTAHAWVEHDGQLLLATPEDVSAYSRVFTWPQPRSD